MSFEYKQIPCRGKAVDKNTPLYRYLSTESFLHLLHSQSLFFTNVARWDDGHEGLRLEVSQMRHPDDDLASRPVEDFYGMCWSMQVEDRCLYESETGYSAANKELSDLGSDAMWRAYCPHGGVRIKTTLGKLEALFEQANLCGQVVSGRVHYDPNGSDWGETIQAGLAISGLFHKRVCFRSESEFRFVFLPSGISNGSFIGIEAPSLYDLIDEVLVSPAKKDRKWVSHGLVGATTWLFPRLDLAARGNTKNGENFCRISQLYDPIEFP